MTNEKSWTVVLVDDAIDIPNGKLLHRIQNQEEIKSREKSTLTLIKHILKKLPSIVLYVAGDLDTLLTEEYVLISEGRVDVLISDFLNAWQGNQSASDFIKANSDSLIKHNVRVVIFSGYDENSTDAKRGSIQIKKVLGDWEILYGGWVGKEGDKPAERIVQYLSEVIQKPEQVRIPKIEPSKEKIIANFSTIKHRIDHIFLPTVIDLQGISDELNENRKDLADDYLKEVFEMRINSDFEKDKIGEEYFYYRNRLNRARYLAVGHQDANTEKALRLVALEDVEEQALKAWIASGQPEAQVPQPEAQVPDEGKAMCDLVHESMRDLVQKTLKSQWERFIKLLGLCQVDDNTFKCNSTSPIQQFMHKMDCWLKEYPKLPEPNEVLDFFKQYQDWGIEGVTIRSFGDWFSELVDAMDKLRDSLK